MNRHNFTHSGYLLRIKAAIVRAIRKAHKPGHRLGHVDVYNRHGKPSLEVIAARGGEYHVYDQNRVDHTADVTAALRELHSRMVTVPMPMHRGCYIVSVRMGDDNRLVGTMAPSQAPMWGNGSCGGKP